jgi:hypothetical protein
LICNAFHIFIPAIGQYSASYPLINVHRGAWCNPAPVLPPIADATLHVVIDFIVQVPHCADIPPQLTNLLLAPDQSTIIIGRWILDSLVFKLTIRNTWDESLVWIIKLQYQLELVFLAVEDCCAGQQFTVYLAPLPTIL